MSQKKNYKKKAAKTQPAKDTQVENATEAVAVEKKAPAAKHQTAQAEVKTDWKPIIKDFCILLVIMGILGYACNLLKDAFATKSETDSLVSLIRKGDLKEVKGEEVDTPFLDELAKGIKENADFVNTPDANGRTPLMWAAYSNFNDPEQATKTDIDRIYYIDALLEKKADINKTDEDGFNALHWAAWSGMRFTSYKLVNSGIDINKAESNGYTPLMLAAMRGNDTVVDLLLKMGAVPTLKNADGKTAAELANNAAEAYKKRDAFLYSPVFSANREASYAKTCAILKDAKVLDEAERRKLEVKLEIEMLAAQASARSGRKIAALSKKAEELKTLSLIPLITQEGRDIDLHHRVKSEIDAIKSLNCADAAFAKTDAEGNTALHLAAKSCKPLCTYQLVAAGFNVTAKNKAGKTPLTLAAEQDDILTVQILLSVDSEKVRDAAKETLKSLATLAPTPGREVIVSMLEKYAPLSKKLEEMEFDARMSIATAKSDDEKAGAEVNARSKAVSDVKEPYNTYKAALEQADSATKAKDAAEAKASAAEAAAKQSEADKNEAQAKAEAAVAAMEQAERNTAVALQAKDDAVAQAAADVASIQSKSAMEIQKAKELLAAAEAKAAAAEDKAAAAELAERNADAAAALAEQKAADAAKLAEEAAQAQLNAENELQAALQQKEEAIKAAEEAKAALEAELNKQAQQQEQPVEAPVEQPAA